MERNIYIPDNTIEHFEKFLLLNEEQIKELINIVIDPDNKTPFDICIKMINKMKIPDLDVEPIFSIYSYLLFILKQTDKKFPDTIPEINYILENFKSEKKESIMSNIENNKENFSKLFETYTIEEKILSKRKYLTSQLQNTVTGVRSVCDLRPLFNEERTNIDDFLSTIYMEFMTTDSLDNPDIISLNFDEEHFKILKEEIEKIDKKLNIITKTISNIKGE